MYIALYQHVTKEVRTNCGRVAQQVLLELAGYCDARGICYPGLARLGSDTGYSVETVQSGLQKLLEHDYIRIHKKYSSVRQKWVFEAYQVSPEVLFIRDEYAAEALRSYDYCNTTEDFVTKDSQPTTEPTIKNQLQEPTTEEPTTTTKIPQMEKTGESDTIHPAPTPAVTPPEKQNQKEQNPTAAQAAKTTKINYAPWSVGLPVESDECAAAHVWKMTGGSMPMAVARYLVATRGADVCYAATRNYETNMDSIVNPGGYIRSLIERQQVDPNYATVATGEIPTGDSEWWAS